MVLYVRCLTQFFVSLLWRREDYQGKLIYGNCSKKGNPRVNGGYPGKKVFAGVSFPIPKKQKCKKIILAVNIDMFIIDNFFL